VSPSVAFERQEKDRSASRTQPALERLKQIVIELGKTLLASPMRFSETAVPEPEQARGR